MNKEETTAAIIAGLTVAVGKKIDIDCQWVTVVDENFNPKMTIQFFLDGEMIMKTRIVPPSILPTSPLLKRAEENLLKEIVSQLATIIKSKSNVHETAN